MGGSGGGTPRVDTRNAPPAAQQIDYGQIMAASSAAAREQIKEQYRSMIENYPSMETLSLGTVDAISGRLGDKPQPVYELRKNSKGEYERVQVGMSEPNKQTNDALSYIRKGLALGELDPNSANPTSIEQSLYDKGESDLALGRSLSPEQIRESQQAARMAMSARGLGTSAGAGAVEVLNREAYATNRERERQGFAASANNQLINGVTQRRINLANLYNAGANNLIQADPYQRALGPALNYSGGTQGGQMQQIGSTFSSANNLAGNVASFNANMLDSRYNSYMNNRAAMNAANMQAGAMNNAATMGMIGSIGGGLLGGLGTGLALSDRREKTDIKPLGKTGDILGLTAYEYRYKDGDEKRVGFMAQDVQKVLPEAVEEVTLVDSKGKKKKRLAVKPAVIGAALTEALMTEQEDEEECENCGGKGCSECESED